MNVVNKSQEKIDSIDYIITEYDNGTITKEIYTESKIEPEKPVLSEIDEAILTTSANVEYLIALKEMEEI